MPISWRYPNTLPLFVSSRVCLRTVSAQHAGDDGGTVLLDHGHLLHTLLSHPLHLFQPTLDPESLDEDLQTELWVLVLSHLLGIGAGDICTVCGSFQEVPEPDTR